MSNAKTIICPRPGFTLELDGRVPKSEAIDLAAQHYRRNLEIARDLLAAVEAGSARVSWYRGATALPEPEEG